MTQTDAKLRSATVDALEGWRGIACLLVVAYHCGLNLRLPGVTVLGFSGVHLFFVLSGYLLFRPYATAMMAGRPLPAVGNFYARRLVRIVPPYAVALAAYVLLRVVSHTKPPDGFNIATHAVLAFNYFPRVDLFSINPVFWSLAIEVQFYLLLPLAAVAAARVVPGRPAACAAGLFVAGVAARWLEVRHFRAAGGATTDVAFRSVFAYLDLFACGMAVACRPAGSVAGPAWRRWATVLLGLALAVAANDWCAATAGGDWQRGGSDAFLVLFPVALSAGVAMLLWTLTTPGRPGPAWLATGPLRWIGGISYSLYLYHIGVQFAAGKLHLFEGRSYQFHAVAMTLLTTPPAVAVAAVMYLAVERPSIGWVSRVRGRAGPLAVTPSPAGPVLTDPSVSLLGP